VPTITGTPNPFNAGTTLTFALPPAPAGGWTNALWIYTGTGGGGTVFESRVATDGVLHSLNLYPPNTLVCPFVTQFTATPQQLADINAAAGGNLSVTINGTFSSPTVPVLTMKLQLTGGSSSGPGGGPGRVKKPLTIFPNFAVKVI
jgi:hypothetical protein